MAGRKKGSPKTGGRPKGVPNKRTLSLIEMAEEMGVNPFQILLHVANGNWKALGYETGQRVKAISEDNGPIFEDLIPVDLRQKAAKDAAEYLYPKRKAIEHSGELDMAIVEKIKTYQGMEHDELLKLAKAEIKKVGE